MLFAAPSACRTATTWPWVPPAADPAGAPIDPNGNVLSKVEGADTWGYEWNAENQLTRVTRNGGEAARFSYDAFGRRVEKVAGGVTTGFAYDGMDILRETRSDGASLKYVHGLGVDEWLGRQSGDGSLTYLVGDALGSVVAETNSAGQVTLTRTYDAWGNLDATSAAVGGPAFTGRWWEPDVQLYDYRARWLDSKLARFISEDPIGFDGGENFYAYVENAPTNRVDPSGLESGMTFNRMWGNPGPNDHFGPPYTPYTCPETCAIEYRNCRLLHGPPAFVGGLICRWVCKVGAPSFRVICSLICTAGMTSTAQSEYVRCYAKYKECLMKCKDCGNKK